MKSALKLKTAKLKAAKAAKRPAGRREPVPYATDVDTLLDEALDDTFPASDPVALTLPSRQRRRALKRPAARHRR